MTKDQLETLLTFFKALGHESRLKIIGILANRDCTVSELAAMLDLKEPTVSQHLSTLKWAGLVDVRPEGTHRYYSFNNKALIAMSKDVFSQERLARLVSPFEKVEDEYERKIFQSFFEDDKLVQFPASDKKYLVILRWFANKFEFGRQYPEKELNEILKQNVDDYASVRRDLIDYRFMQREKGIYWRIERPEPDSGGAQPRWKTEPSED